MPFTLSHIVLALPLKKLVTRLSVTGLIIGSMLPDAEYYLRMTMYGTWGNTARGILLYEIPLGILFAFLFHSVIRKALLLHLPDIISSKWQDLYTYDWNEDFKKNWPWFLVSLLVGIVTHLFWDALTHEPNYVLGIDIRWLNMEFFGYRLFELNQLILSVLGLTILGYVLLNRKTIPTGEIARVSSVRKMKFWFVGLLFFLMVYLIRWSFGIPDEKYYLQHLVIFCSSSTIAVFLSSLLFGKNST